MDKIFKFEKDPDGKWYVILPEWTGDKAELEMVSGADTLLDFASQGEDLVTVYMTEKFPGIGHSAKLKAIGEEAEGMNYNVTLNSGFAIAGFTAWLCHVTKFVFGYFPETIYLQW